MYINGFETIVYANVVKLQYSCAKIFAEIAFMELPTMVT